MTHSKTIKRPGGARYRIDVRFIPANFRDEHKYTVFVARCEPGKKKWSVIDCHEELTPEEIHAAKMELWEKMKPEL